jgi:hypothetical protein
MAKNETLSIGSEKNVKKMGKNGGYCKIESGNDSSQTV